MKLLLPSAFLVVALTLSGCSGSSEPTDAAALARCYATEFGVQPPSGVKNLKAKQVVVGDAAGAWLRFEADSNTFLQIISNRFTNSDPTSFKIYGDSEGGNTPAWWHPNPEVLRDFHINTQWRPGSNYSIAVIAYDPTNQFVYFYHGMSF